MFYVGRSFFKTTEGHIGLAPKEAKPGDLVTALLGCNSADLAACSGRQVSSSPEKHSAVVINGEAFLGPIPGLSMSCIGILRGRKHIIGPSLTVILENFKLRVRGWWMYRCQQ